MEEKPTKTSKSKKQAAALSANDLVAAYLDYKLSHGHDPSSVYAFAKQLEISEATFYDHFASFEALESQVWVQFFEETLQILESDSVYEEYSAREKLLSFYYTWIEVLKKNRSYVLLSMKSVKMPQKPEFLKALQPKFKHYANQVLAEGLQSEEIVSRPYISEKYDEALWMQALFILNFWIKDSSKAFESTDAAIEKAVNLSFELMGKSALDSLFDFAKFVYHHR